MAWFRNINIKTEHEVEIMRSAGQINAEALQAAHDAVCIGANDSRISMRPAEEVLKKVWCLFTF